MMTRIVTSLELDSLLLQIGQNCVDSTLVDRFETFGRDPQPNEPAQGGAPEPFLVKIGLKSPFSSVVCVGDTVAGDRLLTGNGAILRHVQAP